MVNVITELEQRNKELLNEIEQLKTPLQFKQFNNEEIRAWIATVLSESSWCNYGENSLLWRNLVWLLSTEVACRRVIFNAYQYYPYSKQSTIHWQVRNKAKRDIFINLIKLNSEESKDSIEFWS